jgi:ABC-type antimicrobial peptide transport system permease subunit
MLAGRTFSWQDDNSTPSVAVVNREFANKILGSEANALGKYYRLENGTRIQVVGIVEDGKYVSLTEDQKPAMFLPIQQQPSFNEQWIIVRSTRDPEELAVAMRNKLHELDGGLPVEIETWNNELGVTLFPARVATVSLGVMGLLGAILSITGIFGTAAYSVSKRMREFGIRAALGARRTEVLQAALGRPFKLLLIGSTAGLLLGLLATKVLAYIVYQATPRDPFVLAGVVLAMLLLGLIATWIPAQRALSVNPATLLRDE